MLQRALTVINSDRITQHMARGESQGAQHFHNTNRADLKRLLTIRAVKMRPKDIRKSEGRPWRTCVGQHGAPPCHVRGRFSAM